MQTKINHLQQITNPKSHLLPQIAKPPSSQRQNSSRCRHLHVSPPSTTDLHPRTIPVCHTPATQQTDAHFASPKSHFAKPKHEWPKRQVVASGRWRWVAERENAHARKKKKKKKSDSRFLNPNEPFGLGSIFKRGRKQVLAAVQFPQRQKIVFGLSSIFNWGRK